MENDGGIEIGRVWESRVVYGRVKQGMAELWKSKAKYGQEYGRDTAGYGRCMVVDGRSLVTADMV